MSNGRQGGKLSSAFVQHEPVDVSFDEPSRTRQEFSAECDINNLMARFEATGVVSHQNPASPMYLDLSEGVPDLQASLDIVREATRAFMQLPAKVRATFDNDPVQFVRFAGDPENGQQLFDWGLLEERPNQRPPEPMDVRVVNPDVEPPKP